MMEIKDLLPIGSVVLLEDGSKKLMIIGVKQTDISSGEEYDYLSVIYPEGYINEDTLFFFNHDAIDKVFYSGMHDEERESFIEKLNDFYKNN